MATGKNKPKRLDRNRSWRVARRKKKRADMVSGVGRNRKKREKKSKIKVEPVVKKVVKKAVKKKVVEKVEKKDSKD